MLMLQSVVESASMAWDDASGAGSPSKIAATSDGKTTTPAVALSPSHETFDSDVHDTSTVASVEVYRKKRPQHEEVTEDDEDNLALDDGADDSVVVPKHYRSTISHVHFISLFAIFGTIVRIFCGRFFGLDCDPATAVDDFLLPFSQHICVTSSGKHTRGGALFTDLPTNMIGSFLIGMLSPLVVPLTESGRNTKAHPVPWFRLDHPLQRHKAFHAALVTGLCGCLTTCKLTYVARSVTLGTHDVVAHSFTFQSRRGIRKWSS